MDFQNTTTRIGQALTDEALTLLFKDCQTITKKKGEILFNAGDELGHLWTIIEGKVKLYIALPNGTQRTMGYHTQGTIIGRLPTFSREPSLSYCEVVDDCILKVCPKDLFLQRIVEHNLLEEFLYAEAKKEYAGFCLRVASSCPELAIKAFMREGLTHQEIADILGYSRVQVSRLCSQVKKSACNSDDQ